jgi:CheY-like chemotaxis protein
MRQSIFGRSIVGRAMEILLIEDDLGDARATMQVLDRGHVRCRVSLVRDGEEALAFIRRQGIFGKAPRPDLILLDVQLPKKSGCEVLMEIQADEQFKSIPVVVMSTAGTCRTLVSGECHSVLEFMPKPLEAERFVAMVKSLHYSLLTELVAASMV